MAAGGLTCWRGSVTGAARTSQHQQTPAAAGYGRSPRRPAPTSSTTDKEQVMYTGIGHSLGTDYFRIADQLTREELSYLERTRDFVDKDVLPVINGYWERAEFPWPLIKKLAKLRIVGDGCPPMSPLATGLVHMELNRGDGSLGTFVGVQSGLTMQSIAMLGSEEQKQRWQIGRAHV